MKKSQITNMIWVLLCALLLSGCATIVEGAKGVAGISTKALEEGRAKAVKKTFNLDYDSCYEKTKGILLSRSAYIYTQDKKKGLIAVYLSSDPKGDTTPVGVFFKSIDANNTQIEVSSRSTYAKELTAKRIFYGLEGKKLPGEEDDGEEDK